MSETAEVPGPPATAVMLQMLGGFQVSQALYVVAKLGVPTILELEGPQTVTGLAERTGARPDILSRLIRTLASFGIFTTDAEKIANTPLGDTLSESHPHSLFDAACYWMETHYLPFQELLNTARDGQPGPDKFFGQPFLTWIEADPERANLQSRAMAEVTSSLRTGMFDSYELPAGDVVADIGGADGSVLVQLLRHDTNPNRRGIVFDLPGVVSAARETIGGAGLAAQVDVVAGDFFSEVPPANIYVLGYILHDWDDESCHRILRSIAKAGGPGARIVIVEAIVPDGDGPHLAKAIDLTMLAMVSGKERTEQEYRELLATAGFSLDRVVATPSPFSIIEATLR